MNTVEREKKKSTEYSRHASIFFFCSLSLSIYYSQYSKLCTNVERTLEIETMGHLIHASNISHILTHANF